MKTRGDFVEQAQAFDKSLVQISMGEGGRDRLANALFTAYSQGVKDCAETDVASQRAVEAIGEVALAIRSIGEGIMRAATIQSEAQRDLAASTPSEVADAFKGLDGFMDRLEKLDGKKPRRKAKRGG